jgi:hypothetical protein
VLDVSALATLTQQGNWTVDAYNGGQVDLNGLTGLTGSHGVTLDESGNGTILDANLTTLDNVTATLDGADTQVANSWTSFTNGSLTVWGGSYNLPGLTDVDGSSLSVEGGSLALPGLTSYVSNATEFQVLGTGSVLDVSALTTLTQQGNWSLNVSNSGDSSGGEVDLTGLTNLTSTQGISINDTGKSTILDSHLTSLNGVTVTLDGTDAHVADSWTSFINGSLTVTGSSYNLSGLTDADDSNLSAQSGGSLALPGLTTYASNGNTFQANGTKSVLDMSALATLTPQGAWTVDARNGGQVNLNGLTDLNAVKSITLDESGNSTILDGHLTTLDKVNVTLDGADTQDANSWTSFTNGNLTITGGSYNLPGLTDVDGSNLSVESGGSLALPGLTTYAANGTEFEVDGTDSVLDLSALATLTQQSTWSVYASNGGQINLTGLTSLNSALGIYVYETSDGTILDGNLTSLNGVNVMLDGTDSQVANSWTSFTNGNLTIMGGSYNLPGLTDADGSNLALQNGGSLALPGLTTYASNGNTFQASGTKSVLDVSALTTLTQQGTWTVDVYSGGQINLNSLTSLNGIQSITFYETGNSTILDSHLATLNKVSVTLDGFDTQAASSWKSFTNGNLTVTGSSYDLSSLTDFTGSNPYLSGGATLNLPVLAQGGNITLTNGTSVTIRGTLVSLPASETSGATITVSPTPGLTVTLQNSGTLTDTTIDAGQGTTVVLTGGAFLGGTTFNVDQGATVDLTDGQEYDQVVYSGTLTGSGAGTVQLSDGILYPGLGGVTLDFPGPMFQWTGGSMELSVGDAINLGTINLSGADQTQIYADGTLDNFGTVIQSGSGYFGLHSDGVVPCTLKIEPGAQ